MTLNVPHVPPRSLTRQTLRYLPDPVPVPIPFNYQTACDDRLKAGPLRGDPASPRVSEGTGWAWAFRFRSTPARSFSRSHNAIMRVMKATKNMQSERRERGVLETVNILNAVHAELSGGFESVIKRIMSYQFVTSYVVVTHG